MRRSSYVLLLSAAAVLVFAGPAQAGLIDLTIEFDGVFQASADVTVTPGVEVECTITNCNPAQFFPPGGQLFDTDFIDVSDMAIDLEIGAGFPSSDNQVLLFSHLNFGGPVLIGYVLDTNVPWLRVIDFTSNSLTLTLSDDSDPSVGGPARISLLTSVQLAPEPGTLLLLGGGLLALGLRSRRRRQA